MYLLSININYIHTLLACCTICIASAGDWQERVVDLESKVSAQTKEIEMQIEAIATLENQKLDLMQGNLCIVFFCINLNIKLILNTRCKKILKGIKYRFNYSIMSI